MYEDKMNQLRIGLVFAGGGAKGAYETGVLRTLWELNLVDQKQPEFFANAIMNRMKF